MESVQEWGQVLVLESVPESVKVDSIQECVRVLDLESVQVLVQESV